MKQPKDYAEISKVQIRTGDGGMLLTQPGRFTTQHIHLSDTDIRRLEKAIKAYWKRIKNDG